LTSSHEKDDPQPTITDIDGNIFKIVTIGSQTRMAENLSTTKCRNGDTIEKYYQWYLEFNGNWGLLLLKQ